MTIIKSVSIWESTFNLRQPLEVASVKKGSDVLYRTTFLGNLIEGLTISDLRRSCAELAHSEYYTLHVVNNNTEDPSLVKRRQEFDEAVVSRTNKR